MRPSVRAKAPHECCQAGLCGGGRHLGLLAEFPTSPPPCPPQVGRAREQPSPPQTDPSNPLRPQAVELEMTAIRLFTGLPSAPGGCLPGPVGWPSCLAHLAGPVFCPPPLPASLMLPFSSLPPPFCSIASCLFPKTGLWHSGSNRLSILQHECAF